MHLMEQLKVKSKRKSKTKVETPVVGVDIDWSPQKIICCEKEYCIPEL